MCKQRQVRNEDINNTKCKKWSLILVAVSFESKKTQTEKLDGVLQNEGVSWLSHNIPVLWAQSAAQTGLSPASWLTPASLAGSWFHSAPPPNHCSPVTWHASEGTSPGCAPGIDREHQPSVELLLLTVNEKANSKYCYQWKNWENFLLLRWKSQCARDWFLIKLWWVLANLPFWCTYFPLVCLCL